ncbi:MULTISPECIES: thioredoxin family protein [Methylosinus]|uniref:Co-chaperone YbbN n=1 Tax=Methylosinus trichosporium (strain ATCC 35070 / NCIMB 11131 / UNIQEM 75 / OB3b) TaxID=595536 RepID=A0A2D2CX43_METT3|nr:MULTISPECIES: co-chaperone YbbN [Methylosinus]ATQ67297.1 co-chaperone YbbN [Methylosinus trichosporium OB3b]OBS52081.1 co-chaperone YbbN [Methylosinus sp. 3S-1]
MATEAFGAGDGAQETTTAGFRADVMEASLRQPVLVDFWAPWCGPCKQLAPALERAVKAAGGKVKLVKMNIDDHPEIAGQLGIKSIPAVIAFVRGRPADGFVGALPETQLRGFVERLVGPLEDEGADAFLVAEALIGEGDLAGAEAILTDLVSRDPPLPKAVAELARLLVEQDRLAEAQALLEGLAAELAGDAGVAAAAATLENALRASELDEVDELQRRIAFDPDDLQARFDLALALNAKGKRDDAATALLDIIRKDRSWSDDGARKQLIQFFDAWGPLDKATIGARRRLSSLLFS